MPDASLSLEPLTLADVTPLELVSIAAQAGFAYVSLAVHAALPAYPVWPLLRDRRMCRHLRQLLLETGVKILALECFNLTQESDVSSFRPALALGGSLGATRATCIAWDNPDEDDIVRRFTAFADLAAEFSIAANIEFLPFCIGVPDLASAVRVAQAIRRPNAGIVIDFLHAVRAGATAADIARVPSSLIGHVQVCDGPVSVGTEGLLMEAGTNRQLPGDGAFPVADMLAALPAATILAIEAPRIALSQAGISPLEQAIAAHASLRQVAHDIAPA